ncbi:MAG TPA: hypothetical protein VKX49_07240 [Bryobacteraceae bacterium]|nr:hypothetical protein [Bryobacteraceae bacterium]
MIPESIYETADGGVHWEKIDPPKVDGVFQTAWIDLNQNASWVAGGVYVASNRPDAPNWAVKRYASGKWGILHPVAYARTAGDAWSRHDFPRCDWSLFDLTFWDPKRGFAVGDGCFYYTESSGDHWEIGLFHKGSESLNGFPDDGEHPTVDFLDRRNGWLSLDGSSLYRTSDGGKNWYQVSLIAPYFTSLRFFDENRGLGIVGMSKLYESMDGGTTWENSETGFLARSIERLDQSHGWVLSDNECYRVSWQ